MFLVRFLQSVIVFSVVGIVLVLFQAGATYTGIIIFSEDYRPAGTTQVLKFDDPLVLRTFHADLQKNQPDYYSFQAVKGTFLNAKLYVARLVGQDNLQPAVVIFGPGLPTPTQSELQSLPFSLPPNVGLQTSDPPKVEGATRSRYQEAWSQSDYWEGQNLQTELPNDGTYYLAVFSRDKQSGKYALAVGNKTEAGLHETVTFPLTWGRLHYWFNDLWWPNLALVLAAVACGWLLYRYALLFGKAITATKRQFANVKRRVLYKKQNPRPWAKRRGAKLTRIAQAFPYQPPRLPMPTIKQTMRLLPEAKIPTVPATAKLNGAGYSEPLPPVMIEEQPLLTGARWEMLSLPLTLGSPNGNGHIGNPNGNGSLNGLHNTNGAHNGTSNGNGLHNNGSDGLSEWGQRLRPKDSSGTQK